MKKIILTGGGTAGHVTPNIALLPALAEEGFSVSYIGGINGIERALIEREGIVYYGIESGKLRRYVDLKNITDLFHVVQGLSHAMELMRKIKPDIVFSKGGFVTVPVVIAAKLNGIPAVIHESDITPGLANRLSLPFAHTLCVNFPETLTHVPKNKAVMTGTPIRKSLFEGDRFKALDLCGFPRDGKPVIMVTGGSLGAAAINRCVRAALPRLLKRYHIIHLCGKNNLTNDPQEQNQPGYAPFEYVNEELPHLFALADIIISRAGANTLFELLSLGKPHVLIPLTKDASRGDQLLNAASFERQGFSMVLQEPLMTCDTLADAVDLLYAERHAFTSRMSAFTGRPSGVENIMKVLRQILKT